MATIEMENVECVPSSEGIEDEEIQNDNNRHSSKPHNVVLSGICSGRVHELLECPVCTNSMYPPIHQLNSGKVVAVGLGLRDKVGNTIPVAVKEGDAVLLPEYGGTQSNWMTKEYHLYRDEDILGNSS